MGAMWEETTCLANVFEGDWNHQAEIEKLFFFWKMRGVWKASPRRIFLESIQVDFLMQTSEFPSSQVFLRRFHPPSLRSSLWPVASLLPGPWVADTWLKTCFAGACTPPKTIVAPWCALCLYDSMHVSSCFYPVPSMSSPSDSIIASRLWSLRPRAAHRPYSHPDLHRSQRGARQQRHGLGKRGLWGELLCMRPGEPWGTHGGKPKKVGKSGWNVDVKEKTCYDMNCYLINVI